MAAELGVLKRPRKPAPEHGLAAETNACVGNVVRLFPRNCWLMKTPELLAPAGDRSALAAALEAGADAVYLGLRVLNARRLARNFDHCELAEAVRTAHDRGARVYLTLNTDLAERELGVAARILQIARENRVDAVLVRDPALLVLRRLFPELSFHFSTQAAATSSADLRAAAALGIDRVVLAREMTLTEIRAASAVAGVETEVFVQGALCFSVSGRCYLSSWIGGRSGNRGLCASPCRAPWRGSGRRSRSSPPPVEPTPFSMRDLAAAAYVGQLAHAGVAALKIEGRMKNADWVRRAVTVYRALLAGQSAEALAEAIGQLGAYSGREMTCGYLEGNRAGLTGTFGRPPAAPGQEPLPAAPGESDFSETADSRTGAERTLPAGQFQGPPSQFDLPGMTEPQAPEASAPEGPGDEPGFCVHIEVGTAGVECCCRCAGRTEQWQIPKTIVRRKHKAVSVEAVVTCLKNAVLHGLHATAVTTNRPEYPLVPRAANSLVDRVAAAVYRALRQRESLQQCELPEPVRQVLARGTPAAQNRLPLGSRPDRVRLEARQVHRFLHGNRVGEIIVEGAHEGNLPRLREAARNARLIVALPGVFFEDDIPQIERLLAACRKLRLPVEVNNWGGWWLARQFDLPMEGGPGLGVLNSLAGRALGQLGLANVTVSMEADRRQMEAVTAALPVPCSIVVFGRPALLSSRVELPEQAVAGQIFSDRRRVQIRGRREGGLWVFRPIEPFDLRGLRNERIRAAHYVVDLVGADDPVADFRSQILRGDKPSYFNYDRTLQ